MSDQSTGDQSADDKSAHRRSWGVCTDLPFDGFLRFLSLCESRAPFPKGELRVYDLDQVPDSEVCPLVRFCRFAIHGCGVPACTSFEQDYHEYTYVASNATAHMW